MLSYLVVFLAVLVSTKAHKHVTHECMHNEVEKFHNISRDKVELVKPKKLSTSQIKARRLTADDTLFGYEVKPIRIKLDYSQIEQQLAGEENLYYLNGVKIIFESIKNYFESMLKVIPNSGSFTVRKHCQWNEKDVISSDYDLVIYITNQQTKCAAAPSTLGFATSCEQDVSGRPVAGMVNVCSFFWQNFFDDKPEVFSWSSMIQIMTHETLHILGQSYFLHEDFLDKDGNRRGESVYHQFDDFTHYIQTETVKQVASKYYNCDINDEDFLGVPLENLGALGTRKSHWHGKILANDIVGPALVPGHQYLSIFTLALLVDSHWYKVDLDLAEKLTYGINAGCKFIRTDTDCIDKETYKPYYPSWNCDASLDDMYGCSPDGLEMSKCWYKKSHSKIPERFIWGKYPHFGGYMYANYCPYQSAVAFIHVINGKIKSEVKKCMEIEWVKRKQYKINPNKMYFGHKNSRCITGNLVEKYDVPRKTSSYCLKVDCLDNNDKLRIYVEDKFIDCNRNEVGIGKKLDGYEGVLYCPNLEVYCANDKQFECKYGFWSNKYQKCVCAVGYVGKYCDIMDDDGHFGNVKGSAPTTPTEPSLKPTNIPSYKPTRKPTHRVTTKIPTHNPTEKPTDEPTEKPTLRPTQEPIQTNSQVCCVGTKEKWTRRCKDILDWGESENTCQNAKTNKGMSKCKWLCGPSNSPTRLPTFEPTMEPTSEPTYAQDPQICCNGAKEKWNRRCRNQFGINKNTCLSWKTNKNRNKCSWDCRNT